MGVEETLKMLPLNNPVHVLLDTAYKLRDLAIAHTQSLNDEELIREGSACDRDECCKESDSSK